MQSSLESMTYVLVAWPDSLIPQGVDLQLSAGATELCPFFSPLPDSHLAVPSLSLQCYTQITMLA